MTEGEWEVLSDHVTDRMKDHTRKYVTPLAHIPMMKKPLIGSGSYVDFGTPHVLSCEHVLRHQPQQHQPLNGNLVFLEGIIRAEPHPIDAALMRLDEDYWNSVKADAQLIPSARFPTRHDPVDIELLFFRGWADENAYVGQGGEDLQPSGYCSQEKLIEIDGEITKTGDEEIFEMLWEPENTRFTSGTNEEVKKRVRYANAHGLSGALVWNTQFVAHGCDPNTWSPSLAQVTGMVRRWDQQTRTILVWRIEHLHDWFRRVLPIGQ